MFEQLKADIKKSLESKKENDPQRLLKLLKDNPNQFLTIKEWSEIFKKPVPSTRRNLAGLEDNDVITRVGKKGSKGVKYGFKDVDTGVWYKKLLKTGTTKTTKWETSTKVEIFTYEQNDKCRYLSLMEAALKEMDYTEEIAETGYSSSGVIVDNIKQLLQADLGKVEFPCKCVEKKSSNGRTYLTLTGL